MDFIYTFIRDFDGSFNWIGILVLIVIAIGLFFLVGAIVIWLVSCVGFSLVKEQYMNGEIRNKYYTPESSSIGTGIGTTAQGNVGSVVTSNYTPAKYTLEIHLEDGDTIRESVSSDFYDECEIGDPVKISYKISKWMKFFSVTAIERT